MVCGKAVLCLLVLVAVVGVHFTHGRQVALQTRNDDGDDIPQRCVDHSVTEVSCSGVSEDALMPHPDDCELFYYCVGPDHIPLCRQCPAGLHFSPTEHVCDVPEHAGCAARVPVKLFIRV